MNRKIYITFLALFLGYFSNAQREGAIWYFGDGAGVDFNSGAPVALTNGQLYTNEGCATISDRNGSLLFYTDGSSVYNRNHVFMQNGTGLNGNYSSTHSAVVVPKPGSISEYYIFTVDVVQPGSKGFQYSIVDMSLDGGLGAIVEKNVPVFPEVTERIAAYKKSFANEFWIVTRKANGNEFMAYNLTAAGLNITPVISAIGIPSYGNNRASGQIEISQDGKRLALANAWEAQVFDFNENTGEVTNEITVMTNVNSYGVEFSPNGNLLYVSFYGGICQLNLLAGLEAEIQNSKYSLLNNFPVEAYASSQTGPDGKIYITKRTKEYLDVIHEPNNIGAACDYRYNDFYLDGRRGLLGLPTFISNINTLEGFIQYEGTCLGDDTIFKADFDNPSATILWDFGDGTTSTDVSPVHEYMATGTYLVSLTLTEGIQSNTENVEITISEYPVANTPTDLVGCTSYGSYNIDLPSFDPTVLGTQDPNDFSVAYFLSQADADSNVNALEPIHSFDYGTTPVYVRVSNANNGQCYDTTQFNIVAREAPLVDTITDWTVCDDDTDGLFTFDLSQKNTEIFNGQDETMFEILYFASQADADAGTNPLSLNYTNTAATEEIFVRFQNSTYTDCFRTGSFNIEVIPGVTANRPTDLSLCDDNNDGEAIFDLSQTDVEIIGTQNPGSLNISYHESQDDADAGTNQLNANAYLSTAYQSTIFVRVENASDTSCYDTTSFGLTIFDTPIVPTVTDWQVCDDNNDGFFLFNLSEKENEILNGASGVSVSFYVSQTDSETSQNPITGNYQNTSNPQTIHFRLENTNNSQCYTTGSFLLQVFDMPTAYTASNIIICDTEETGSHYFDLSQKDDEVLNGQNLLFYDISYFISENDALNNLSPLSKADYQNTNLNETIWARIQHTDLESCFDVSSFNVIVNPLPQMNMEERYVICPDSPDLVIDGGDFESYSWRDESGNEISNQPTLDITALGDYSLIVSQTTNGITCENTAYFEVVSSGAPETLEVDLNGFSDEIELELLANGIGEFEYSIDGENYQSSNSFTVFPGQYTVYVRDRYECRTITQDVTAMGYQRFFTPNGDGTNENWKIIGADLHQDAQLYIYDRYGKLLKQLAHNSEGWDGTYQGQPMPSSDYWFRFVYDQDQVYTGHFTLKR
ncbi:T9SS type B sorting domain-containing protein [Maribacter cobaltidurans]|uniref:Uncharacterized protein n=1 Tax=Maribacter cobaltidurans TaxID=1178778 RepID=A0A223V424_9FLAO|nr:T9SS type B sorting domain-containing protein [Maribacter cobaltidurans]ASV30164.1 hypothetical protein CJ263_07965 [Maribacter cobaltidurans]GGD76299.1 T9SS C-terminal target domain-containing protein [Maribacter cobaltidurans]